jgi:endonuclease G
MLVFTGPILKESDPKYKNSSMDYTALIPLAFWKICVLRRKNGSLAATAFTLDQEDVTNLPGFEEKFDVTTAQVTVQHLETLTGLDFGPLKDHDHFAAGGDPGTLEISTETGTRKVKPIENFDDIVV